MNHIPEYKDYLDSKLLGKEGLSPGKMFGYPAYYVNGKLAVCHYEDNVIIKLPAEKVNELVETDKNASREGPKPRKNMGKEWVFLHIPDIKSLQNYIKLCEDSIRFVANQPNR